ncbi:MAG: helix-turn-helix transcriptional regulator [Oscillospiraceae bacterium]|jgi:DNA-binding Xre family transcriptional regulator|nr:helix-turn-helix transcriptional regulator [Oscillospiraceae bacterium]
MTRAYDETYLDDAMNNLGDMFDYALNDCGYDPEAFFGHFIVSGVAKAFAHGNPKYVAGLSGPELASEVIFRTQKIRPGTPPSENVDKSAEYWAGWSLAYYQWATARRFDRMHRAGLTMTRLLALYPTLHEADVSKFVSVADRIIEKHSAGACGNLQRIRRASGMTQKRLAEESGTALRMIQIYEQRRQDINRAQALTLDRIARALGCEPGDLLEDNAIAPGFPPYPRRSARQSV